MRLRVLAILAGAVFAQAQPTTQAKGRISGKVVNSLTGEPLRKARVTVSGMRAFTTTGQTQGGLGAVGVMSAAGAGGRGGNAMQSFQVSAATDSAGGFTFDSLDAGRYTLSAQRQGFQTVATAAGRTATANLEPGGEVRDVVLKLEPFGVVSGRVRDDDGDSVRNVQVALLAYQYTQNGRQLTSRSTASTNDLGEYRLYDVPAGKYYLRATPNAGGIITNSADEQTLAPAYYPGVPEPASAAQLEVQPGQEIRGIELALRRVRGATVRGRVIRPPELAPQMQQGTVIRTQVMGVTVMQMTGDMGGISARGATTDAQGNFEARGLAPGNFIFASQAMVGEKRYSARVSVQVGQADIDGIELRPAPPLEVNGTIRLEGNAKPMFANGRVMLQSRDSGYSQAYSAQTKEDGTFTIKNVEAGAYRITASLPLAAAAAGQGSAPTPLYLKSVRCGNADATESGVDFTGGSACDLTVTFSANGGQIEGTVERDSSDSQQQQQVIVTIVPDGPRRGTDNLPVSGAGANGSFRLAGIAPGTYKVFAWDGARVDLNAVRYDPEYSKPYESQGQTVRITENAKESLTLKLVNVEKR
jgi:hypothetical protein